MRHAFSFPEHIREKVKEYIEKAVAGIDMKRFLQEPDYTAALATSLHGIIYEEKDGYVKRDKGSPKSLRAVAQIIVAYILL